MQLHVYCKLDHITTGPPLTIGSGQRLGHTPQATLFVYENIEPHRPDSLLIECILGEVRLRDMRHLPSLHIHER